MLQTSKYKPNILSILEKKMKKSNTKPCKQEYFANKERNRIPFRKWWCVLETVVPAIEKCLVCRQRQGGLVCFTQWRDCKAYGYGATSRARLTVVLKGRMKIQQLLLVLWCFIFIFFSLSLPFLLLFD